MFQKLFKKSPGFKMAIPRKGWSDNKSLSPVMMQEAFGETANSRYLLSLGSLHSLMISAGEKSRSLVTVKSMISSLSSIKTNIYQIFHEIILLCTLQKHPGKMQ